MTAVGCSEVFHFLRFECSDSDVGFGLVRSATKEPTQSKGLLLQTELRGWVLSEAEEQ